MGVLIEKRCKNVHFSNGDFQIEKKNQDFYLFTFHFTKNKEDKAN